MAPAAAPVAVLRLFAAARQAAGTGRDLVPGSTVGAVLEEAVRRYGPDFAAVLAGCRVWSNGEPATSQTEVADGDEVAVLPPVSGGSR
jgi:molybdopterin synthase sulfur carrier subunit